MIFFLFLSFLPLVFSRNVIMLGDSVTMDMKNFNFNLFEPTDNVINYARSAFSIELTRLIIDPYRDINRLNVALTEHQTTNSYSSNQVIIPNIQTNPPDVISIMIGLKDTFDSLAASSETYIVINRYKHLLDRIEQLVPSTTIVLINTILPADNTGFNEYYKDILLSKISDFNEQLETEINSRNKLEYRFVNLYNSFLLNGRADPDLFLAQNDQLLHPSLNGYTLWKQKLNKVLLSNDDGEINPVAFIRTNHWDTEEHRNFFQLYINDKFVGNFLETSAMKKEFVLPNETIYKIEVIMSTWSS